MVVVVVVVVVAVVAYCCCIVLEDHKVNKSLKTIKNSEIRLAILDTALFRQIAGDYGSSNIIVLIEHQEYDEDLASIGADLRADQLPLPPVYRPLNRPPKSVRAMTVKERRF